MDYAILGSECSMALGGVCVVTGANGYETVRFSSGVASWGFSGSADFCVDLAAFCDFIAQLKELHDNPMNHAIVWGAFEEQFIRFRPHPQGYTEVNGKLIRYYPRNAVEFEFLIDRAEFRRFVGALSRDFKRYFKQGSGE